MMSLSSPRLATLSTILALALSGGCVVELGGIAIDPDNLEGTEVDREQPIFGGSLPTEPHHAAVVSLHNRFGGSVSRSIFCSGTLISPTVVLTAAHCTTGEQASRLAIYVGDNPVSDPSPEFHNVSEIWVHPSYSGNTMLNDISLLRLSTPVTSVQPVPPLPQSLGFTTADTGSLVLEFAGFGRTETGGSNQKLVATAVLGSLGCTVSGCGGGMSSTAYRNAMIAYNQFSEGPCNGDSGGPAFVVRGGQVYVGGMTSFGDANCTQYGVSSRADSYESLIYGFSDDIVTGGTNPAPDPGPTPDPTPDPTGNTLDNGIGIGLQGATGSTQSFTAELPAGSTNLVVTLAGGSGDADLYVRFGAAPTTSTWDCRPYLNGNNEQCTFAAPSAGTWHIQVRGYSAFSGATLTASWTEAGTPDPTPDPTPTPEPFFFSQGNLAAQRNTYVPFTFDIPAGTSPITFLTFGGSGDADMYVKKGTGVSTTNWDCRPYKNGNAEECVFDDPAGGTYTMWLVAYRSYNNVTLQVSRE